MIRHLTALAFGCALALPGMAQEFVPQFRVTGTGEATAVPDIAILTAGAVFESERAEVALEKTSESMAEIRAVLDEAGILPSDIQTTQVSLSPRYRQGSIPRPGSTPGIESFIASNRIEITLRDLDRTGVLLDALARSGANEIGAIRFDLANDTETLDAARRDAIADAQRKAQLYADATGVPLGPLLQVFDGAPQIDRPFVVTDALSMRGGVPLAEGTLTLRAQVTLVYLLGE